MDVGLTGESLTEREREILDCLAHRLSNQEIADRLHLSLKTVKWYNTQIFEKLGVKNRAEAIARVKSLAASSSAIQPKNGVPTQVTPFFGREFELRDLTSLLADPSVKIVTILAPGGMGKTRLAIETAARSIGNFAHGACFVSLAHIGSPDELVTAIGDTVGLNFLGAVEPLQQLFDFLHDQTLLLVLDNFEHLLAGAPIVTAIVAAATGVKVLITSREKLNLSGETVYTLGGMAVPDTTADPLSFDSVRLFLFHARRVRHDFAADDLASIARIAQLTQGMPLGLVLAAAWVDVLSPAQILDEISRSVDVLQQEMRDVPMRHRSIRAVFDPTWERLTEEQRDVFMRLSVFRAGFTREAAQAVAGADLRMLSSLVGKSLLQPQAERRFVVHELLRQYGESHLNASNAAHAAHAAHAAYFMDFLAQREADVKGRRQTVALREISEDFENIHHAWLWSLAHDQYAAIDHGLECFVLAGEITGKLLETHSILRQSADRLAFNEQTLWERVIVRLARLDNALRIDGNFELVEVIIGHVRERDEPLEIAWCLWVLADREAIINGRDRQALSLYEELVNLCRVTGNDYLLAHGLTTVSWRYANNGDIDRAVNALRESIAIRRKVGDVKNLDYATAQLSWMTFDLLQDTGTAEALLDEQISLQNQTGTTSLLPLLLGVKATMAFLRYDVDAALQLAQTGLAIACNQDYLGGLSMCKGALGLVESHTGNYKQARLLCQEVGSSGSPSLTAFLAHWVLSLAHCGLGDETNSIQSLTAALQIACRFRSPTFQGMCLLLIAIGLREKHDPQRAVEYLGYCFSQPSHLTMWLHKWPLLHEICSQLQSDLGLETYSAAWVSGQALELNAESTKVLAELHALR